MPFRPRAESEPTPQELQAQIDALTQRVSSLEHRLDGDEMPTEAVLRERGRLAAQHRDKTQAANPWNGIVAKVNRRTGPGVRT